eukprot:403364461
MDATKGSTYQLLKEVVWSDAIDCYDYVMILYDHFAKGLVQLPFSPQNTMKEWSLIAHKSPTVFKECWQVYNDTMGVYDIFNQPTFVWKDFGIDTGFNLLWNFADIVLELQDMNDAIKVKDYNRFGENLGKITSDLFVKNPTDVFWNVNNSNVYMAEKPPGDILSTQITQMAQRLFSKKQAVKHHQNKLSEKAAIENLQITLEKIKSEIQNEKQENNVQNLQVYTNKIQSQFGDIRKLLSKLKIGN